MAADARITLTAEGASNVQDALRALTDAAKQANAALKDTGSVSIDSSGKVQGLKKYFDDLVPSTKTADATFKDLKGTLSEMWENPTAGVSKFAGAIGTDLAGSMGTIGIAAGGAAAALAVLGLAEFELAEHAASVGGALNDMSEKTGISVPALSNLSGAVKIAGGTLDQVSGAIFKFQQNLGEGSDKFVEGLQRIHVSIDDIKSQSPDQQFLTIAAAIKGVEDPSQRAAAAVELFGKQGKDLLPLLNKPLDDLIQKSRDLGLTWTTEDAAAAEEFEMETNALKLQVQQFAISIGRDLIPQMTEAVKWMQSAAAAAGAVGRGIAAIGSFGSMAGQLQDAAIEEQVFNDQLLKMVDGTLKTTTSVKGFTDTTKGYTDSIHALLPTQADEKTALRELEDQYKQIEKARKDDQKAIDEYAKAWQTNEDAIQKIWGEAFVAEQETGQKSLAQQIAVLEQKRRNDENAATQKISETTRSEDQLGQMLYAIRAKYSALEYTQVLDAVHKVETAHGESLDRIFGLEGRANQQQLELTVRNNADLVAAQRSLGDLIAEQTLSTYDARERTIKQHLEDERKALEALGGDWQQTFEVMKESANREIDAIEWERIQDKIDETDRAMEDWVNRSIKLFGQLGQAIGQIGGTNLSGLLQAFGQTGVGQQVGGLLQNMQGGMSDNAEGYWKLVGAGAGVVASATDDPATKAGQYTHDIAKGAQIGTAILPGWGTVIGAGVGALTAALSVSPEEKAARASLEDFNKKFGSMDDMIKAVGASYALLGKTGVQAEADIKAALDASHISAEAEAAALAKINGVLDQSKQRAQDVADAVSALGPAASASITGFTQPILDAFKAANDADASLEGGILGLGAGMQKAGTYTAGLGSQIQDLNAKIATLESKSTLTPTQAQQLSDYRTKLLTLQAEYGHLSDSQKAASDTLDKFAAEGRQGLDDLGLQAVQAFTAMVAGGSSVADAFKSLGPSLTNLQSAYEDLGLSVDDVALKNLLMENQVSTANPQLIGAISGLSTEMQSLAKLGGLNVETFESMERTGSSAYARLQDSVSKFGGSTKDALIPMQAFLHEAAQDAQGLGIPLDDNTQSLIDQSKELGIWKDVGKDATQALNDSTAALNETMQHLVDLLSGPGGVVDAFKSIPTNVDVNVTQHVNTVPGSNFLPGDGVDTPSFANEGFDITRPMRAIVGDNPFQSESVLHASTVKDIVRASRNANSGGNSAALEAKVSALHGEISGLRRDLLQVVRGELPIVMKHALRGVGR